MRELLSLPGSAIVYGVAKQADQFGFSESDLISPRWQESIERARTARNPLPVSPVFVATIAERRAQGLPLRKIADHLSGMWVRMPPETVSNVLPAYRNLNQMLQSKVRLALPAVTCELVFAGGASVQACRSQAYDCRCVL